MKIALYLQDITLKGKAAESNFYKKMEMIKNAKVDLLVFPENTYTPFDDTLKEIRLTYNAKTESKAVTNIDKAKKIVKKIYELCGTPMIFCSISKEGIIYSYYLNPDAKDNETQFKDYFKHVATGYSALDLCNYEEHMTSFFSPIVLKGFRIGHTICYDSNFPLFSRAYGVNNIDILINSTGGHTDYKKWSYYQKVRAIENTCYNFCVMAHASSEKRNRSFVIGYDRCGHKLGYKILDSTERNTNDIIDGIYIYEISKDIKTAIYEEDEYIDQNSTINKYIDINLNPVKLIQSFPKLNKVRDNIYQMPFEDKNIIFALVNGKNILVPEKIVSLLYEERLRLWQNKRYIIVNTWQDLNLEFYNNILSNILKVRAMENYCAVMLESDLINVCYQVGKNKNVQVLETIGNGYGLDLERMTGPEGIWKNNALMRKEWRQSYLRLFEYIFSKTRQE